jgi:hypothetical protein
MEVLPGSRGARTAGTWLTVGGAIILPVGILTAVTGLLFEDPVFGQGAAQGWYIGGGVVSGVGAVMLATGIALIATSGTHYRFVTPPNGARWTPANPLALRF